MGQRLRLIGRRRDYRWEDVIMSSARRHPKSADVVERAATDFASKTLARPAKLSLDERAARLAAVKKVVEHVESIADRDKSSAVRTLPCRETALDLGLRSTAV